MCATRLAQVCQSCGFANPLEYRYCSMCGTPLAEAALAAPPAWQYPAQEAPVGDGIETSPAVAPAPAALEGERRVATVILADVKNSTGLMEKLGTEAWVEVMNRVFQILEAEIYRLGGQVDQFRGDGLVAFFGATLAHEDDPERAVLAALFMQRALKAFAAELDRQAGVDLRLRIGVNTGEVIVTSVGDSRQYRENTAMGEAVTLAARMETSAEPGTVLVSENTYRLVETKFTWQPLGQMAVKGASQPVAVYRPLDPLPEAELAEDLAAYGLLPALTGRKDELQALQRCIEDLFGGRGGIVVLTGHKGMGKSFLLTQVQHQFAWQAARLAEAQAGEEAAWTPPAHSTPAYTSLTWLRGTCRSYDQAWPFSMWLDMLQRWLGVRPEDPQEEKQARLLERSQTVWGEQFDRYYPYLATFLKLPLEEAYAERVRYLDAEGLQQQFFSTMRSWIEELARRGPLVLTFADLHWADVSSLELLRYCLPLCDSEALLWLLMFRPERASPAWELQHAVETEYPHRLTVVDLPPFSEAESREMIEQLIGPQALSEKTSALLIHKVEGNPYYIREILHALIAQGVLERDAQTGTWRETRSPTSLDLPDSLQSLLLERIDRLAPDERRVLQLAAVMGSVFWRSVVEAMVGESNQVRKHLTALQRAQLIQERGQVPLLEMEYSFTSSLVRDVAYESLLSPQRAAYHLKVAEYLEDKVGFETRMHYASLIAYHYRGAGNHKKELFYTLEAAEQARGLYANAEAYEHYSHAIALLDEMEAQASGEEQLYAMRAKRFEVLNGRSRVCYLLGDISAGDADARALLELARQMPDDPIILVDALLNQPEVHNPGTRHELETGLALAQEALSLAQQHGDQRREMESLQATGGLYHLLRDPRWRDASEHALVLARQIGDLRAEVHLLLRIGSTYGADDLGRNQEYLEAALAVCQQLDDKGTEMHLIKALSPQFERSGDYYRLLTEYEQKLLQLSRETGNRLAEAQALSFCAQIEGLYLGDYKAGLAEAEEAQRILEGTAKWMFPLLRVAHLQAALGQYAEAQATIERARPFAERNVYDLGRAALDLVQVILCNAVRDEERLRSALELTGRITRMVDENLISRQYQMAAACEATSAHLGLAELLRRRGAEAGETQHHLQQALAASQSAVEIYRQFGFVQVVECTSEEILFRRSLALDATGYDEEAAECLQQAYAEMHRKHALIPEDSRFRTTYLENIRLHREIQAAYQARQDAG